MILSTTDQIEGQPAREYLGVVNGEAIVGVNVIRDWFAAIRDIVGGRAGGYQAALKEAREAATDDLVAEAIALGANAVVGLDIDYEVVGRTGSMLLVSVNGTAVRI